MKTIESLKKIGNTLIFATPFGAIKLYNATRQYGFSRRKSSVLPIFTEAFKIFGEVNLINSLRSEVNPFYVAGSFFLLATFITGQYAVNSEFYAQKSSNFPNMYEIKPNL